LRLNEERARADREADSVARLRDELAVTKLQEQQAAARESVLIEKNEKLQGEFLFVQGRLQVMEQQLGEQLRLVAFQQQQQQQHQQLQQHHSEELKSLRIQRDSWEAEARQSKSIVSDLLSTNARLQVKRCPSPFSFIDFYSLFLVLCSFLTDAPVTSLRASQ
jgi:hypothetical protein